MWRSLCFEDATPSMRPAGVPAASLLAPQEGSAGQWRREEEWVHRGHARGEAEAGPAQEQERWRGPVGSRRERAGDRHRRRRGRRGMLAVAVGMAPPLLLPLCALLALCLPCATRALTNPRDVSALLAFKAALETPANLEWPDVAKGAVADPCAGRGWKGVQCVQSATGEYQVVNAIQIINTPLGGTLSPDFANLTAVRSVFLGSTGLGGTIPSTLSRLRTLELLGLDRNNFTAVAPATFATLTRLSRLYLLANPIQGEPGLPSLGALTNLDTLDLTACGFGGPIPPALGALSGLTYLGLSGNRLTGPIPEELFASGFPSIVRITLSNNQLNGSIPWAGIGELSTLQDLSLQWNQLSGTISPAVSQLSSLTSLTLNSNNLVGPLPQELGTLLPPALNLQTLDVSRNSLVGPLPQYMGAFPPARWAGNGFCSNNPGTPCSAEVSALLDFLGGVQYPPVLSSSWQGPSPCTATARPWKGVICSNGRVAGLVLPRLGLEGKLAESLGQLSSLVSLQLQNNSLTGPFPLSVQRIPGLARVNIANNSLTGVPPKFADSAQVDITCNNFVPAVPCGDIPIVKSPPPVVRPRRPPGGNSSANGGRYTPPPAQPSGSASRSPPAGAPSPGDALAPSPMSALHVNPLTAGGKSAVALGAAVGAAGAALVLLVIGLCLFLCWRRRRSARKIAHDQQRVNRTKSYDSRASAPSGATGGASAAKGVGTFRGSLAEGSRSMTRGEDGTPLFSIEQVRAATDNFAESQIVGKGGFATVYKGTFPDKGEVAVKRMEVVQMSGKGQQEFQAEINVLTGVRHRHLVSLLGFVQDEGERLLIYEYMALGPLSHHLFQPAKRGLRALSWERRLSIAVDVAKGVEYLHHLAHKSFIHRDLKPSNILLDSSYRAKVADFGLVKPTDIVDNFASVETRLAGTFGYLAPEYAATGRVTVMSDVYSFGVILMELITGRRALDESQPENRVQLVAWLTPHIGDPEKLFRAIDPVLADEIQSVDGPAFLTIMDVAILALHCVARDPRRRPNMSTVVASLTPLVAKWHPQAADHVDTEDSEEGGASLAEEVEKWQEEEEHEGTSHLSFMDDYPSQQGGFMYPPSVHSHGTRGTDGFSTMAEPYSMIETRPASAHAFMEDMRGPHSFAGYHHSHTNTSQADTEVPTSMREAPVEPR